MSQQNAQLSGIKLFLIIVFAIVTGNFLLSSHDETLLKKQALIMEQQRAAEKQKELAEAKAAVEEFGREAQKEQEKYEALQKERNEEAQKLVEQFQHDMNQIK